MAYTILRTEVPLTGTPLEDRYSLTSLSFKELEKDGFSRILNQVFLNMSAEEV